MTADSAHPISRCLLWLICAYQRYLSPLFPARCIYTPTCSEYARQAILRFGAAKGLWLALRRLLRCHPFHAGGYDPVPEEDTCGSGS